MRGWIGKVGKEVGVAVGRTFPVLQLVCVGEEELEPTPGASIVLVNFGDILEGLVVGVDDKLGGPKVTVWTLDGPIDASGVKGRGPSTNVPSPR